MRQGLRFVGVTGLVYLCGCQEVVHLPPGSSPLANAVVHRRMDLVSQLLKSGSSPDSKDERGTAALILAAATDQFQIANVLTKAGASIWEADTLGYTPAVYAHTSHVTKDSPEDKARVEFISFLREKSYPWPPPWPDDVLEMKKAGNWPPK